MKASEMKLRMISGVNNLIDTYFGTDTMADKFINSTLKVIVKQKSYMVNDTLELFTDKDGNIDEEVIINEFANTFKNETITIDIRDYIQNGFIKSMLPNKALVIKIDDILDMLT